MINHLDKLPYVDAKSFLDQTEDRQALQFLIDIAPFMDETEWLILLDLTWPRIPNADDYQEALRATPYGKKGRRHAPAGGKKR
ncbi:MAG: hypothetical protein IV085_06685 [Thiobacillus sp.]|nr:hypothetical protein [Thiobacillus sp.]